MTIIIIIIKPSWQRNNDRRNILILFKFRTFANLRAVVRYSCATFVRILNYSWGIKISQINLQKLTEIIIFIGVLLHNDRRRFIARSTNHNSFYSRACISIESIIYWNCTNMCSKINYIQNNRKKKKKEKYAFSFVKISSRKK